MLLDANAAAAPSGMDPVIGRLVLDNAEQLIQHLQTIGCTIHSPTHRDIMSGIVAFDCPGIDNNRVRGQLLERGVNVSVRNGHIRASTHAYNNTDDFRRLVDALKDIQRNSIG